MNRKQKNKFSMYKSVEIILDENVAAIGRIASFQEAYQEFKQYLEKLSVKDNIFLTAASGLSAQKKTEKINLYEAVKPLANALFVYAETRKNENLKMLSDINKSQLSRLRYMEFLQKAKSIFQNLALHIPDMASYGVDQGSLETLKIRIAIYEEVLKTRESRSNERKTARKDVDETFRLIDALLHKKLDKMIELVKKDALDFYHRYFSARGIKDLGHRRRITDVDNRPDGEGVPGM